LSTLVYQAAKALLLPLGLVLLLLLAHLLWPTAAKSRRLGQALGWLALLALFLLSTPFVAGTLATGLERIPALDEARILKLLQSEARPEAILVLGGGRHSQAPEYGADVPGTASLERLRYAARLARSTGLPIMVSGGSPYAKEEVSEAELGRRLLQEDYGIEDVLVEGASPNTRANLRLSAARFTELGYRRVFLVTHAWHMPRALAEADRVGLDVIPAPTGFFSTSLNLKPAWRQWLPSTKALHQSQMLIHEYLGLVHRWLHSTILR
jgi:uncharacterized SAM-binding protein YcdF (DUF218 family)